MKLQEAIGSYERCLELAPQSRNAGQNRLLALNYIMPGEDAAVCTAHIEWWRLLHSPTIVLRVGQQQCVSLTGLAQRAEILNVTCTCTPSHVEISMP